MEDLGQIPIEDAAEVELKVECDHRFLRFYFRFERHSEWRLIGGSEDALILSDEYVEKLDPVPNFGFTGAFVGLAAWDMTNAGSKPSFDFFKYRGMD